MIPPRIGLALLCTAVFTAAIPLQAGQRNGVLSGRIEYGGAPAPGIRVAAVEAKDADGPDGSGALGVLAAITESDSAGVYRLENIPPGRYVIMAGSIEMPAYYPGSSALGKATILTVTEGSRSERLDFAVSRPPRLPGVSVRGRVTGISEKSRSRLSIVMQGPSPSEPGGTARINADGTFAINGVQAGAYGIGVTGEGVIRDTASFKSIVVEDKDVVGIALVAVVQTRITGQLVVLDSDGRESNALPRPASVAFVSTDSGAATVMVDPRGGFALSVREGEYFIRMPQLPAGFAIKSISSAGKNFLSVPVKIEWSAAALPVTIQLEYKP